MLLHCAGGGSGGGRHSEAKEGGLGGTCLRANGLSLLLFVSALRFQRDSGIISMSSLGMSRFFPLIEYLCVRLFITRHMFLFSKLFHFVTS